MKGLAGFSPMRQRGGIRVLPPLPVFDPARTVSEQQEKDDAKMKYWISQVGEDRALIALSIFQEKTGSRTLPELLTEAWLRNQGARYVAQLNLGHSRPDFVVFQAPGAPQGAMILRVQGTFWHGSAAAIAHDQGQKDILLGETAQGIPIVKVIDLPEKSIYESDTALELAYFNGQEIQ